MTRVAKLLVASLTVFGVVNEPATAAPRQCSTKHGEAYIICAETGGDNRYLRDGAPHPGKSSASGAYGLLRGTRRTYGRGCDSDRCIAARYAVARYGSWVRAAAHHRAKAWW